MELISLLSNERKQIFQAVKSHAERLLDHTPHFRYFTLHGTKHINNMITLCDLFINGGLTLSSDEAFLLSIAICVHDLGMVVPLKDLSVQEVLEGKPQPSDPTVVEFYIRDVHHDLVQKYISEHFDFLSSLGVSPPDCGLIKDIARSHRKISLTGQEGSIRHLGAFLRIIDELDIGPERAPAEILLENYGEMDSASCWHWFKHNIFDSWRSGHNVIFGTENGKKYIRFTLIVRPPTSRSIHYWLNQTKRPILKALSDDRAAGIVSERWGINILLISDPIQSRPNELGEKWEKIEQKALSAGRRVILLVDDEVRKMEDLFVPLMDDFHVIFSPNAKDALTKIQATNIDLAIIDLQVGSGFLWDPDETEFYKMTGKKLCQEIIKISPKTNIGILTGTRYDLKSIEQLPLAFLLKKPVDPESFEEKIYAILGRKSD